MELVVLCGPPAVGKLTVGTELARLTGFALHHNHLAVDLVGSLFRSQTEANARLREVIWLAVFDHACRYGLPGVVFTIAFSAWSPTAGFLGAVERLVAGHGGDVRCVELTCAREELLRRVVEPSRSAYDKVRDGETLTSWLEQGRIQLPQLKGQDVLRIDTTTLSASDTAKAIAAHFGLPTAG